MGFVLRKFAPTGEKVLEGRRFQPVAPGAVKSPQQPGEVPDVSSVPERGVLPVPLPVEGARRPQTEYQTAQRRLGVYQTTEFDPLDPDRFETMALPSYEERRKAQPVTRTPVRPQDGYVLSVSGSRLADQLEALAAGNEAADPAVEAGQ